MKETQKAPSYLQLIRKKDLLLYLIPWIMLSLINSAEAPMIERAFGGKMYTVIQFAEYAFIGVFAIVGGAIADRAGRKRVVIAGFVMIGIEYAALSAFSSVPYIVYLFMALDGITWGLLFSVFFTVIWGDLGEHYEKEKYYTIGCLTFLLSIYLSIIIKPYVENIALSTAFTVASFFLFIAVVPLMMAPETLPEKAMKERDLKSYLDKVQKIAQKESEKKQKPESSKPQKESKASAEEKEKDDKEYEEAKKLAEKYY